MIVGSLEQCTIQICTAKRDGVVEKRGVVKEYRRQKRM